MHRRHHSSPSAKGTIVDGRNNAISISCEPGLTGTTPFCHDSEQVRSTLGSLDTLTKTREHILQRSYKPHIAPDSSIPPSLHHYHFSLLSYYNISTSTSQNTTTIFRDSDPMQHLLFLIMALSTPIASAMHIQKRDDLTCDLLKPCVSSYVTGSIACNTGYERTERIVSGSASGSYCERPCTPDETLACVLGKCNYYKNRCALSAGDGAECASALRYCKTPIKATKENCTPVKMGRPVKYNADGTCEFDLDADQDTHLFTIRVAKSTVDTTLFMSCEPVTSAGANSINRELNKSSGTCMLVSNAGYVLSYRCKEGIERYDGFEKRGRQACAVAAHPGSAAPVFKTSRS